MGKVKAPIIRERPEDYDKIEKVLSDLFKEEIYIPLIQSIVGEDQKIINSDQSFLIKKISDGKISYYRGEFSGSFSARSSKELKEIGAVWSGKSGTFKLGQDKLPKNIKGAISVSGSKFDRTISRIKKMLSKMLPEDIAESFDGIKLFDDSLWKADKDITDSLKSITVTPQLTSKSRLKIAKEYNNNMQRYIKNWTEKEIRNIRALVEKEALSGKRYENLVLTIEKRYNVSQNKAKFLARQETGLMMAKFKESRYVESGSPGYVWTTVVGSEKSPVRKMHKELNGKYFTWDNPPITNLQGDRNHPGEDYNCRCSARAVIKF